MLGVTDKSLWNPYYYSKKKIDYVYNNRYHCFRNDENIIYRPSRSYRIDDSNIAFPYINKKNYDIGCFGCSITKGHDLPIGTTWPDQLSKITGNTIANFGVGGINIAGIFMNLKMALQEHQFKRIVILLPTMDRSLQIIKKAGYYFRIPVALPNGLNTAYSHENKWFDNNDINKMIAKARKDLINGSAQASEKKHMARIKKILALHDIEYHISSWDPECYEYVNNIFDAKFILPIFDTKDWKKISEVGDHLHQDLHTEWINLVANNFLPT